MNLGWVKDEAMRDRVGADLILCGSAYVIEEIVDGGAPRQTRVDPRNVKILSHFDTDGRRTAGSPTIHGYEVTDDVGKTAIYEPSDVWHGRLSVEGVCP